MPSPAVTRRLPYLLGVLIAVGPISTDMYLPAFPAIARDFHAAGAPQLSLAAYFLGLALGQMTQGPLSDRFGRRGPLLAGMVLYTLASLACALAPGSDSFAFFRFLSALGGSAGVVIPRAMVRDMADGAAAARIFSKLMLVMGVAPIAAPMLGAMSMQAGNWRLIFGLAALYGVISLALVWYFLPDTLPPQRRIALGPAAILVRYGAILRERMFLTHALILMFASATLFAYLSGTPEIFVGLYGWSATQYAALFGVCSIAYICYNQLNPVLVARYGIGPVISLASGALLLASLALALLAWHPFGPFSVAGALLFSEMGFGFVMPCSMVGALSNHQAHAGSASALMGTMQYSGGALACLAMGAFPENSVTPMASAMLVCAGLAVLAAMARPRLTFAAAE